MTVIHCEKSKKCYFFDAYPRDAKGMPTTNLGSAVLLVFENVNALQSHIISLARTLKEDRFEIVCMKLSQTQLTPNNCTNEFDQNALKLVRNTFHCRAVQGSVHQGSDKFSVTSRGRQCSFMALSFLLYSKLLLVSLWERNDIDKITIFDDVMFSHALQHKTIPDCISLLIRDLPVVTNSHDNKKYIVKYGTLFQGYTQI